jgi:hypothetical protein
MSQFSTQILAFQNMYLYKPFGIDAVTDHVSDEQRRVNGEDERPVYLAMTPARQETRLSGRSTLTALGCYHSALLYENSTIIQCAEHR